MRKQQTVYFHGPGGAALRRRIGLLLGMCLLAAGGAVLAEEAVLAPVFVAGTAPDHRRTDAPVIKVAPPLDEQRALHGVDQPYPASLGLFIKDQGAWYTPFTQPGMLGRYDIRGYHRQ
ncbi:MAG: hypothetical protein FWC58_08640 [Desulfobulbus sp.]|nr:hypothetical protein [Desulfobulbus sp.]